MLLVHDRIEKRRLNGYRQPGELYLVGTLPKFQCCILPANLPEHLLPKAGLQPVYPIDMARGLCPPETLDHDCPGRKENPFAGMYWISEKDYQAAAFFHQEARSLPIQIKIKRLHCGIEIGKSWVLLAHRKAIVDYSLGCSGWVGEDGIAETDVQYKPGIFSMFRVDAIEYVVPELSREPGKMGPNEKQVKEWQDMSSAGITLVKVYHSEDLPAGWELEDETEITEGYE